MIIRGQHIDGRCMALTLVSYAVGFIAGLYLVKLLLTIDPAKIWALLKLIVS